MESKSIQIRVRDGLLERLQHISGLQTDEAMAGAIGVGRVTYSAVKRGEREPSIGFAVGVARAFGLGLSEIVTWEEPQATQAA